MDVVEDAVIVVSVAAYGESDTIVRCFGRDAGRFSGFARGARASRKRFPGLQAPALGTARSSARRGSDMRDLKDVDVDDALVGLGADLRAFGFAGYVLELIERFVPEGAPQPELFDVVRATLRALAQHGPRAVILRAFELQLLDTLGVLPDLSGAVDDPGAPVVAYDAGRGHLLAHDDSAAVPFSEHARQACLFLLQGDAFAAVDLAVDDDVLREVSRVFAGWLRRQGVKLRSLEVLRAL